jgi:hypothetical protein
MPTTKTRTKAAQKRKYTFLARLGGALIDRRVTTVPYTHAVVAQRDEAFYRIEAYSHKPSEDDLDVFGYSTRIAAARPGDLMDPSVRSRFNVITEDDILEAKERIEGGFEAFCERARQQRIDEFEEHKRGGGYSIRVRNWLKWDEVAEAQDACEYWLANGYKLMRVIRLETASAIDSSRTNGRTSRRRR